MHGDGQWGSGGVSCSTGVCRLYVFVLFTFRAVPTGTWRLVQIAFRRVAKHNDKRRDPVEVARVIWDAANDPSNQLRYLAGQDAAYMDQMRKASSDEDLFNFFGKNYAPAKLNRLF